MARAKHPPRRTPARKRSARRGLLLVMIDVDPEDEDELNRWYEEEHLAERASCPGFLSARRFVAVEGKPKFLALYDLDDPGVLNSAAYKKIRYGSAWTRAIEQKFKNWVRNVYVDVTPDAIARIKGRSARRGRPRKNR